MPGWIGPWEIAILLVIVLLVFGPKRLPEMGRSLGRGMREFKDSVTGKDDDDDAPAESPAAELPAVTAPEPTEPAPAASEPTEPVSAASEPKEPVSAASEHDSQ